MSNLTQLKPTLGSLSFWWFYLVYVSSYPISKKMASNTLGSITQQLKEDVFRFFDSESIEGIFHNSFFVSIVGEQNCQLLTSPPTYSRTFLASTYTLLLWVLFCPFSFWLRWRKVGEEDRQTLPKRLSLLLHPIIRKIPNYYYWGARAFVMIADLCNNGK